MKEVSQYDDWIEELDASIDAVERNRRKHRSEESVDRSLQRLNLMQRYARENLRFQRSVAAEAPPEARRKVVGGIADLIENHPDEGVFLIPPRLTRDRLYRYYGVE